jgi:predicted O-linked N-acetylglucosamine transferase (SPINDLY family)
MININIISNNININNIKYIFLITNQFIPLFITDIEKINNLPKDSYTLVFNKFYSPKKNFCETLNNIISNNKGFHFLSKDKEIYITDNISYENKILNIKKKNKYEIIFDVKINKYEHINIVNKEYNDEDIDIISDYYKSYYNIFNKPYSYDSYKLLHYEIMKNCYYIVYSIKDIAELTNLPKLKYYNHRIIITHSNLDCISISCLKNFCKVNKYEYTINKNILNKLNYLWFEKIIFMNYKSQLNDNIINDLNEMHESFAIINKYDLKSIKGEYLVYFNDLEFKRSLISFPSSDINYNLLYNKIIEMKLLKIKGYDMILDELGNTQNKTTNIISKLLSMCVLCNRDPPLDVMDMNDMRLNLSNNIDTLFSWFILFMEHKPNKIIDYTKLLKKIGKNIFDIIISKDLLSDKSNNIYPIIIKVFDKLIRCIDKDVILYLIEIAMYLQKYATLDQMKGVVLLLTPYISRYETTYQYIKLLEKIFPNFKCNDLLTIFPNNPLIIDLLIHVTCNFVGTDNLECDIFEKRNQIEINILKLLEEKNLGTYNLNQILTLAPNNFYLSYHGIPSKNIFELKHKLFKKICPELNYCVDLSQINNNKIKVCFISSMLNRIHSVFKDRHQVIKHLSLNPQFEVYFITTDDLTNDVRNEYGNAIHIKINKNLLSAKDLLTKMKLDIIVYCEIGMDSYFYLLACMRFAKIQINTWGHSDTSGLDTIDYFFSSKLYEMEYKRSKTHYTEKLVLLNSLCTCYINPYTKYKNIKFNDRYHYGFNESTVIYFCAQSIFKFNKIYYDYIVQILNTVPNAILFMIKNEQQSIFIKNINHNIVSRIHWVPPMKHYDYLNLINISDVVLDTYPFGGCNSSLEAFSLGKVVVSQPGQMINGRFTKGFYTKMGLKKYIANNKKEYVDFAIKLANKEFRDPIEKEISENAHLLFEEKETITEWTDKLIELHNLHKLNMIN